LLFLLVLPLLAMASVGLTYMRPEKEILRHLANTPSTRLDRENRRLCCENKVEYPEVLVDEFESSSRSDTD
jgi:hypothetical protein